MFTWFCFHIFYICFSGEDRWRHEDHEEYSFLQFIEKIRFDLPESLPFFGTHIPSNILKAPLLMTSKYCTTLTMTSTIVPSTRDLDWFPKMGVTSALKRSQQSKQDNFEKAGGGFVLKRSNLLQKNPLVPVFHILGRICPLISYLAWYIFCLVCYIIYTFLTLLVDNPLDMPFQKTRTYTSSTCDVFSVEGCSECRGKKNLAANLPQENWQLCYSSWWFQPIWKILVKLDHFPR